jgi:hypothetical protein
MQIGDSLTYHGRTYVVAGFTPMSVEPAEIQLRDPRTGTTLWVEWAQARPERAALRLAPREPQGHEDEESPAAPLF